MSVPTVPLRTSRLITFDGLSGTGLQTAPVPIFTVTNQIVVVRLVAYCTVDLVSAGGGTLALGVTGATTLFIGATTATAIDATEFWVSTTPTAAGIALPAAMQNIVVGANVIGTIGTADITAGAIRFDLHWVPVTKNATVSG